LFNNPLNSIGKEQLDLYEKKKDEFLDQVLHKGSSWTGIKAEEVENSEFFKQYIKSMHESGTFPSLRGLMVCVDKVMPWLRFNNENTQLANYILTSFEVGKYGDITEFKKQRGASRKIRERRTSPEDKAFVR
jgi:hypothetical protein